MTHPVCTSCQGSKRFMVVAAHCALAERGIHVTHKVAEAVVDAVVEAAQLPEVHLEDGPTAARAG